MRSKKFILVIIGLIINLSIFVTIIIFARNILITVVVSILTANTTLISFYFGYNVQQKKIISQNYIEDLKEE